MAFVVAAPLLWLITGVVVLVGRNLLHWREVFWYPFLLAEHYSDLFIFNGQFAAFRTPAFWVGRSFPFTYPAPAALAFYAFFTVPGHQKRCFLLFVVVSALVAAVFATYALRRRGLGLGSSLLLVGVAVVTSYPFMFLFDRANIEIVNWICVTLAIAAVWRERWKTAGALLGVAISLKLFPVILLGLFVARRRFVAAAIAIGTAVGVDIVSLAILGPSIAIANRQIALGLKFFQENYVYQLHLLEIPFDHSLFAIVKHLAAHSQSATPAHLAAFAPWYMGAVAIAGLALYFTRIWRLPRINQIAILLTLSVLLPPVSSDYTLVHLYPAWLILALFALRVPPGVLRSRVLPACFVLLAIVFCPETYLHIGQAHIAGSAKALALCALIVLLLAFPCEENRFPDMAALEEEVAQTSA